jgi:hypothetical protein
MNAWPNSADSLGFFVMKELYDQTGMLGEIRAKVDRVPEVEKLAHRNSGRLDRLETKFDEHLKVCPAPRRAWWRDLTKENWSWLLAAAVLALNLLGQPQAAEKLSSASPRQDWWDSSR